MDDVVTFKSRLVCESKPGDVDRLDYCLRKNWGLNKIFKMCPILKTLHLFLALGNCSGF